MHWCTACGDVMEDHPTRCYEGDYHQHFPALCCPGCDCGSFEEAHSEEEIVKAPEELLTRLKGAVGRIDKHHDGTRDGCMLCCTGRDCDVRIVTDAAKEIMAILQGHVDAFSPEVPTTCELVETG